MALSIIVREAVIDEPVMIQLAGAFQRRSSSNKEHPLGTIYQFSNTGESRFTQDAYLACDAHGCLLEGGIFYSVMTEEKLLELTPVEYRDSEVDGKQLSYGDYFDFIRYDLEGGTWLVKMIHGNMGLTDADRVIYQNDLGTLLVKSAKDELYTEPTIGA